MLTLCPGSSEIAECMHCMNGNGAGSRKSQRKRNRKGVSKSFDDMAGINVKQLGDLLKLLLQLLNLLGSGSVGGHTLQQLSFFGQVNYASIAWVRISQEGKEEKEAKKQAGRWRWR